VSPNEPTIRVEASRFFSKAIHKLRKKYRHIGEEVASLIEQLQNGDTPGDVYPEVGYTVFKVRLPSVDQKKGKSGGFRVIYYLETQKSITLITIYAKADKNDISPQEIRRLIKDLERRSSHKDN
jgi:mRNA-degrading endonuclease RelE of RelBE toxin-antitoxin system